MGKSDTHAKELEVYYICGFLNAISSLKDVITPDLGGQNQFFTIPKDETKSIHENIIEYLKQNQKYYLQFLDQEGFEKKLTEIDLAVLFDWEIELSKQVATWTSDQDLVASFGHNGTLLSDRLVKLLSDFLKDERLYVYKLRSKTAGWHWAGQISDDYVFETKSVIHILHFGESS